MSNCGKRKLLFVGGQERPNARKRLEAHLGVKIVWAKTSHSKSPASIDKQLRQSDLVVVWYPGVCHTLAGHVNELSRTSDAPRVVRLKAGYSPSQVEQAIRMQAPNFILS